MGITIKDVAQEAKVSTSTVSRVISNNPRISDETKSRVMKAVKKLNYHPNVIARSLANNSTHILGLILPSEEKDLFKNPFFIKIMTGISVYAQKKGYYIMYSFGKDEEEQLKLVKDYIRSRLTDGIILLTSRTKDKCIQYLKEKEFPFVVVGRPEDLDDVLWVDNDNFQAMYKVVSHLISGGHEKIAYIGGPENRNMSKDRLDGYRRAMRAYGVRINESMIFQMEGFTEEYGYEAMKRILEVEKPTAVVTTDDLLAFGANKLLRERKITNISLVGFNNTPLAEYQTPPISSVNINEDKLGYYAAKILIHKLENQELPNKNYLIEANLIERDSTRRL